ncbi:DUF4382 domain-containing protein [Lyngbya confervoides]|uniref:DUF4382 domain-containing protein n=1 Tax=Lyngbya confervoides BDU141951 TaxID=1574623 RepID=A0ABD4T6T5_9CYAN|nr:DUF4382 domain-containing protein [Lyngbya confervoides]MCM1984277.1 DUF4382 domain-containing protein [Lyngbya confervoides BDU141951]
MTSPTNSENLGSENSDPQSRTASSSEDKGTLTFVANGEDFVRQGFVSKDGWQIDFDHVYTTLGQLVAYQSDPPFDAASGGEPQAQQTVTLPEPATVDLAAGDATADPVQVGTQQAASGRYNALSWTLVPAPSGPAKGYSLMLVGQATKAGTTVDFALKMDPKLRFVCGDFVGDTRRGILDPGSTTELESTFHFDHLFGDAEAGPTAEINQKALGFQPFADLAENNRLEADSQTLKTQLSSSNWQQLNDIMANLGHVGEGHCAAEQLA